MPTDNSDLEGKLLVRRAALRSLKGEPALVLDCFAGEGHMFDAVWKGANEYLGLEKRFSRAPGDPHGHAWKGDNRLLVERAMRRRPWNIIDLDAYGTPWGLLKYVVEHASADRLAVTTTCGIARALCSGSSLPYWVRDLIGMKGLSYSGVLVRFYDDIIRWTVAYCLARSPYHVRRCRRARSRANPNIWYWLFELERPTVAESPAAPTGPAKPRHVSQNPAPPG
jgi:hypothetical protein